jgi:hypothetical protein
MIMMLQRRFTLSEGLRVLGSPTNNNNDEA